MRYKFWDVLPEIAVCILVIGFAWVFALLLCTAFAQTPLPVNTDQMLQGVLAPDGSTRLMMHPDSPGYKAGSDGENMGPNWPVGMKIGPQPPRQPAGFVLIIGDVKFTQDEVRALHDLVAAP